MPRISHQINSFNDGELAPEIMGRTDIDEYNTGAKRIENMIVHPAGGAHRRSGTRFVEQAINAAKKSRLIPFIYSTTQAYMLEFSEFLIRVYANEVQVAVEEHDLTAPSTTTDEFTFEDHGYVDGQGPFRITATGGIPTGLVEDTTDYYISMPKTLHFTDDNIELSGTGPSGPGGQHTGPGDRWIDFGVPHGYVDGQGPFRFSTKDGPIGGFSEIVGHTALLPFWVISPGGGEAAGGANIDYYIRVIDTTTIQVALAPTGGAIISLINPGYGGTHTIAPTADYLRDKFRLSLTSGGTPIDITGAGTAPHTFTPNPNGTPAMLPLDIPTPYTEAEVQDLKVQQSADFLFIDHPKHRPAQLTRSGSTKWAFNYTSITDGPFLPRNIDSARTLNLYDKEAGNTQAFLPEGSTGNLSNADIGRLLRIKFSGEAATFMEITGIIRATDRTEGAATAAVTLFTEAHADGTVEENFSLGAWSNDNWPAALSFFEQRLAHGGEARASQTLHGSATARFNSFAALELDDTVVDTNAVDFVIAMNDVNAIRWMVSGTRLVIGTSSGLFTARGSFDGEPITPSNIQIERISTIGALGIQPVIVDDRIVYVTANSASVRGFRLTSGADTIVPEDLTLLARHILGRTLAVSDMAYQQDRHQVVWIVRSDGVLAAVTYVPEQEVKAWHRHILGGVFGEATITVSDYANIAVGTTLEITKSDGTSVTFTSEALGGTAPSSSLGFRPNESNDTTADNIYTAVNAHSDFTVANPAANIVIIKETSKAGALPMKIASSDTTRLATADEGRAVVESVAVLPAPENTHDQVWLSVKRTVNGATVRHIEFFADEWLDETATSMRFMDSAPIAYSGTAVATVSGLDHLEGERVQILAEGAVHPDRVVSSGSITLDAAYTDVVAGLQYVSELETLRLDFADREGSSTGKVGRIDHLILRLYNTIGGEAGPNMDSLDSILTRSAADPMDEPVPVFTGDYKIGFDGGYEREKRIVFRQSQPLPFNILSVNVLGKTGQR